MKTLSGRWWLWSCSKIHPVSLASNGLILGLQRSVLGLGVGLGEAGCRALGSGYNEEIG